jgi:para-aminobenzoate synthetase/4-amino-4-deoxychorismate lyase
VTSSFVLLDDCNSTSEAPKSRLYTDFVREIVCSDARNLKAAEEALQEELEKGRHAVLLCDYEFGLGLMGVDSSHKNGSLRLLIFREIKNLSAQEIGNWLADQTDGEGGYIDLERNVNFKSFDRAVAAIRDRIGRGDTYQSNYTYRLKFKAFGEPVALYRRLRERQPAVYGALAFLPDDRWILSFSPELFVRCSQAQLSAGPIKGTAAKTGDQAEDRLRAAALVADEKSRAENLMIVDLLRSDLGRVAQIGSVAVTALFEVESFGHMFQLVSRIKAAALPGTSLTDILVALFPCGSITGAPKRKTMEIIEALEPDRRGIYTGAIGWIDRPVAYASTNDFCFSVAIRTLELESPGSDGLRQGTMGVGAGILYDSDSTLEYAECELKSRFFTELDPDFKLFETMYAERENGCRYLDRHLARLQASAVRFGFRWDEEAIRKTIDESIASFSNHEPQRVRLALNKLGEIRITAGLLEPLSEKVEVGLAAESIRSEALFLRHKTTVRTKYDRSLASAVKSDLFDLLFFNERGELCEGARSNVFLKLSEGWFTPPVDCGLLPGIMRSVLLEDANLGARERVLHLPDLESAEEIFICNALRGRVGCRVRGL